MQLENLITAEFWCRLQIFIHLKKCPLICSAYMILEQEKIEFLRFNSAQQNETIRDLSAGIKERNFIEAKEKGFDKDLN